ncbi:hypothetical protein HJC23_005788 [Cyclotella cryptica]|uniref:pantothenate kinase n=1 Tax=Cyclotella cryptica TaxID=29204 RepID=A0ABD3P7U5_9STRA|eukprot:CCRYP_016758-RA/>CCRYP_016758-RA protein AED:0.03 eAED:0.03 QI:125/1/1/1/0.75/0.6/5/1216/744
MERLGEACRGTKNNGVAQLSSVSSRHFGRVPCWLQTIPKNMFRYSHYLSRGSSWAWAPFIAGAVSASVIWALIYLKYELYLIGMEIDGDSDDESNTSIRSDEKKRDGLIRWPWDKLRSTVINASSALLNISDYPDEGEASTKSNDKTGPCIGAIFGLDVGGTLTKLVYFEEQIQEYKRTASTSGFHRKEHYHAAASAFQVLQARTSTMGRRHDDDSETDLQLLMGQRIESMPDSLDEFASSCNMHTSNLDAPSSPKSQDLEEYELNVKKISSGDRVDQYTNCSSQEVGSLGSGLKKSMSMVNVSTSHEHAEVLTNFYSFARRLDTYQTAVKEKQLSYFSRALNGQFHFIRFETRHMQNAMNLMRINNFHQNIKEIGATGGGAHKYADDWDKALGIKMAKQDEMDSLVAGMQFVLSDIVGECYTFKPNGWKSDSSTTGESGSSAVKGSLQKTPSQSNSMSDTPSPTSYDQTRTVQSEKMPNLSDERSPSVDQWWTSKKVQRDNVMGAHSYPYLLVSIGTGVSILRVDGPRQHERVSGSTIGGGTYWGLCRLLTGSDSFSDVLNLAMKGDPSKVDMMVGDIYGKNSNALEKIGLPSDIVASSFGKLVAKQNPSEGVKEEDLARALLLMVTNNIGQVAHLNARLHNTSRIYFVGTFLQHNTISQQRLAHAIDYWSKGETEALFLEHEGYFGALGAFLLNHDIGSDVRQSARQPYRNSVKLDPLQRKKRPRSMKLHHRSKSMSSMQQD